MDNMCLYSMYPCIILYPCLETCWSLKKAEWFVKIEKLPVWLFLSTDGALTGHSHLSRVLRAQAKWHLPDDRGTSYRASSCAWSVLISPPLPPFTRIRHLNSKFPFFIHILIQKQLEIKIMLIMAQKQQLQNIHWSCLNLRSSILPTIPNLTCLKF